MVSADLFVLRDVDLVVASFALVRVERVLLGLAVSFAYVGLFLAFLAPVVLISVRLVSGTLEKCEVLCDLVVMSNSPFV